MESHSAPPAPHVQAFVEQLLGTGGTLVKLVGGLADAVVASGSMGEQAADEIVGMLTGTVAVRLASIPEAEFVRASELMELAMEGVRLCDCLLAYDRSRSTGLRRRGRRAVS
jgi:hypothetical protein